MTVDEEIYRLLPALLIGTVDKFAQIPWQGAIKNLFGRVSRRCERHGYRAADLDVRTEERDSHVKTGSLPACKTIDVLPLRPPDLIIQDELHLISGALGTMAGLYETAIDELASWTIDGATSRPKVVASTATVRRAEEQNHALFWRHLEVFPAPLLDISDSFFARQRIVSEESPGRRYVGICAPGIQLKATEIRIFVSILGAAQKLFEEYGVLADPYMTLVAYFGALRELAGMRRLVDDDVTNRLRRPPVGSTRARRVYMEVQELTSRLSSSDIPAILDQLEIRHDPAREKIGKKPIDVLLSTSMISVGVDVSRLGLMTVVGQPKATAEYIQATSRVGRDPKAPGLVFTIYNWSRPRDLSHFERFEHYHATFYRQVEALSVTPFAKRALDRALTAVLVGLVRQESEQWNPNSAAETVDTKTSAMAAIGDRIAARAAGVSSDASVADEVKKMIQNRLDDWTIQQATPAAHLGYQERNDGQTVGLLQQPELGTWTNWTCPNSLRETEPNVNVLMDLDDTSLIQAPSWEFPKQPGDEGEEEEQT